jgi:hypothetical protein
MPWWGWSAAFEPLLEQTSWVEAAEWSSWCQTARTKAADKLKVELGKVKFWPKD